MDNYAQNWIAARSINLNSSNSNRSHGITYLNYQNTNQQPHVDVKVWPCDTCDRVYYSYDAINNHMKEHKVCGIEGCTFTAHSKIVEKHIMMQHKSGLYDKIKKVVTEEDILKWREERKKNYPTVENVERKRKLMDEMYKRGERIFPNQKKLRRSKRYRCTEKVKESNEEELLKQLDKLENKAEENLKKVEKKKAPWKKRKISLKKQFRIDKYKEPKKWIENHPNKKKFKWAKKETAILIKYSDLVFDEKANWNGSMFPFKGTKELYISVALEENEINDSEWQDNIKRINNESVNNENLINVTVPASSVNNALHTLMAAYNDSNESDYEEENPVVGTYDKINIQSEKSKEVQTKEQCNSSTQVKQEFITHEISTKDEPIINESSEKYVDLNVDDESPIEENISRVDIFLNEDIPSTSINSNEPKHLKKRKQANKVGRKENNVQNRLRARKRCVTLLEKLLEKDIVNERNVLLQCVRFIVENNFFENNVSSNL